MSQVLGTFGLLGFTMIWPVLTWLTRFYEPFISLIFQIFLGRGKPRILNLWIRGSASIASAFKVKAFRMKSQSEFFLLFSD
jgi:hypothetical protein